MKMTAVLNKDGGTLKTADLNDLTRALRDAFKHEGRDLKVVVTSGDDLTSVLDATFDDQACAGVIAGGGDGTISAAAARAFKTGKPFGVLPAGTMNLFARSFSMPLTLDAAIGALAASQPAHVDIATVNGHPFIHQFAIGIQPRMVKNREQRAPGSRLGKIGATALAFLDPILDPPDFEVVLTSPTFTMRRTLSLLAISNNLHDGGHLPYPDRLDKGKLGIYALERLPPGESLRMALDLTLGQWHRNSNLHQNEAETLCAHFPALSPSARAVIDGELCPLEAHITFQIHKMRLPVFQPQRPT